MCQACGARLHPEHWSSPIQGFTGFVIASHTRKSNVFGLPRQVWELGLQNLNDDFEEGGEPEVGCGMPEVGLWNVFLKTV